MRELSYFKLQKREKGSKPFVLRLAGTSDLSLFVSGKAVIDLASIGVSADKRGLHFRNPHDYNFETIEEKDAFKLAGLTKRY